MNERSRICSYSIAECNNVRTNPRGSLGSPADSNQPGFSQALIYPGLGLGTILSSASQMTDKMIIAGAQALAALSPALKNPDDALLPPFRGDFSVFFFFFFLNLLESSLADVVRTR